MQVIGVAGLTEDDLALEVENGGRFVMYRYCVSVVVMTFHRNSSIYFVRGGQSGAGNALKYSAVSCVLGWWGLPWGPIFTLASLFTNIRGGIDVTSTVLGELNRRASP